MMKSKKLKGILSVVLLTIFCWQGIASGKGKEDRKRNREAREMERNARRQQRQSNVQQIQDRISRIRGMGVSDPASADQRCKAIADSISFLKNTNTPKRPFDGKRYQFRDQLKSLKHETRKMATGLSCERIDFFVPDDSEIDE